MMIRHLLADLLLSPVHSLLWWVDEILFGRLLDNTEIQSPVFIVSQPRCGSTFLHRVLAEDDENFFALTYFEWRWPYICVWWVVDRLGLRDWINLKSYWNRRTHVGKLASEMHPHLYGDYEEHGVFLEEKFYQHYFVFRRFPILEVMECCTEFDFLRAWRRIRVLENFLRVVRKVSRYRGGERRWLTKENESVTFYHDLIGELPSASLIFLVRYHADMLASYVALSRASTLAKTGVDLENRPDLHKANLRFRSRECQKFCGLFYDMRASAGRHVLIGYDELIGDVPGAVELIYNQLEIRRRSFKFRTHLANLQRKQGERAPSYRPSPVAEEDLRGFELFERLVETSKREDCNG